MQRLWWMNCWMAARNHLRLHLNQSMLGRMLDGLILPPSDWRYIPPRRGRKQRATYFKAECLISRVDTVVDRSWYDLNITRTKAVHSKQHWWRWLLTTSTNSDPSFLTSASVSCVCPQIQNSLGHRVMVSCQHCWNTRSLVSLSCLTGKIINVDKCQGQSNSWN